MKVSEKYSWINLLDLKMKAHAASSIQDPFVTGYNFIELLWDADLSTLTPEVVEELDRISSSLRDLM